MFNNCVTIFTTISFIPFVMEEWIFKHCGRNLHFEQSLQE